MYFCLGLVGFISLLCSIAASSVTNENLMKQGFLNYSQTAHLNVSPTRYGDYAKAITQYLDGKTVAVQVTNPDSGELENAFSDKENAHLADVRGIVTALKIVRWAGGGIVIGRWPFCISGIRPSLRSFYTTVTEAFPFPPCSCWPLPPFWRCGAR